LRNTVTGETYPGSGGFHCAVAVADCAEIPRFLADFHERLWLAGFGWGMGSAAGSFLERSLVDKACGSPERLIFEGRPIVEEPLEQAPRDAVAHEGAILDTMAACPPLTAAERLQVKKLKAAERARLQPQLDALRAKWSESHVKRMVEKGATEDEAHAAVARWIDRKELSGDFPLPFDDPDLAGATVADVLASPKKYVEKTLADPFEGPAYGRGKAIVYRRKDASIFINSYAHGGAVYELKALEEGAGFEDAAALIFAAQHERDYRYVSFTSKWMQWRGFGWIVENTLAAFDAVRALCRAGGKGDAKTVSHVEKLARSDRRLAATIEQWDADPYLLATPGGAVDLKTGELRPARPEDYCSKQAAVAPADGEPVLWLAFLNKIFNGDQELIAFLQPWCGYCLTGDVSEHCFLFLYGSGRNGKGTFCRTLLGILADYACGSQIELFIQPKGERHPTDEARLYKKRLTVAQETPKGQAWNEAKVKNMSGGDPITASFMRQDFFDFWPEFKIIIAGNHKPRLKIVDEAIRARLLLIPFLVTIDEAERDPQLTEKLREEWPLILRWMIAGCLDWRKNSLRVPKSVRESSANYFHEQDHIAHWLDERTERKAFSFTPGADLFKDFEAWLSDLLGEDADPGSQRAFTLALQERGITYANPKPARGEKRARGFKGLTLKPKPDDDRSAPPF
jgi:putative DNA primase/helicase